MIFKQLTMVTICFQIEAKILHKHGVIAINIPCKFGDNICINERDIKVYVKT